MVQHYQGNKLQLPVKDDGVGFDKKRKRSGFAVQNVNIRTELCNGLSTLDTQPRKGCVLSVEFVIEASLNSTAVGNHA